MQSRMCLQGVFQVLTELPKIVEVFGTYRAETSRGSIHNVISRGSPSSDGLSLLSSQACSTESSHGVLLFILMHLGRGKWCLESNQVLLNVSCHLVFLVMFDPILIE